MSPQLEIILIASLVSVAAVIPGVFLVLRGIALMSDAISHAILLGIVVAFFVIQDLGSPLLLVGASLAGVLTVTLTEALIQTQRLKIDAAIGIVFPVFFSLGVILINLHAGGIHIDADAVLLGELAFAPFNRSVFFGIEAPKALWTMGMIVLLNLGLLVAFYKELKLVTFDPNLARSLGVSTRLMHYGLMSITSLTAVGAFDAVGSILVVALMIAPPSTAFLLTDKLSKMIGLSILIGITASMTGYGLAHWIDASIAGAMASMCGVLFLIALLASPKVGIIVQLIKAKQQKIRFASDLLLVQLLEHEHQPNACEENTINNAITHMNWTLDFTHKVVQKSVQTHLINRNGDQLFLTPLGREQARAVMVRY